MAKRTEHHRAALVDPHGALTRPFPQRVAGPASGPLWRGVSPILFPERGRRQRPGVTTTVPPFQQIGWREPQARPVGIWPKPNSIIAQVEGSGTTSSGPSS
jgi:hypothetical protein